MLPPVQTRSAIASQVSRHGRMPKRSARARQPCACAVAAKPTGRRTEAQLRETNRRFYDALWRDARLVEPRRFNTWPLVSTLVSQAHSRLEVAPGLRPR